MPFAPLKSLRSTLRGIFSGWGGSGWGRVRILKPGSHYDWEALAGPLHENSAVAACLRWILNNYGEPQLVVRRKSGKGHRDPIENHALAKLWNTPNPEMDAWDIGGWAALSCIVDGNGYHWKQRGRYGNVVQLWPLHHWLMSPVYPADGSRWLDGWNYRVNGTVYFLPADDVIHYKWGFPDRNNDRLYVSPLKSAIREVCTDNEAVVIEAALLKNAGIPSIAIVPQGETFFTLDQAKELKQAYKENFTADNIGDVFVPTGPVKIEKVGSTLGDLNPEILHKIPETRIAACIGIPLEVVGLLTGKATGGISNHGTARSEARKAAYEDCLTPLQKRHAAALQRSLLPEFESDPDRFVVGWDYTAVQCMAESEDAKVDRYGKALASGGIMRSEFRTYLQLKVTPDDEVYYLPKGVTVVMADNEPVEALMPPAPVAPGKPDETPPNETDTKEADK